MLLWTAILLGLLSGFHCLGMCGPIALAIPVSRPGLSYRIWNTLAYNSGRIFSYSLIGFLFALFGRGFALAGFQQQLSIIIGLVMIISVLLPRIISTPNDLSPALFGFFFLVKKQIQKAFKRGGLMGSLSIGLANGFLPCGMVYMGVAGALSANTPEGGALYMAAFGLGTLPLMLSLPLLGQFIGIRFRNIIRKGIPYIILLFGLLFLIRGLNLGIPYLSPKIFYLVDFSQPCI